MRRLIKKNITGEVDFENRVKRLLKDRTRKGIFLVLDYAEVRQTDVKRLANVVTQMSNDDFPVRILLLARKAGQWWDELLTESRSVKLLFDSVPMTHENDFPVEYREKFFMKTAEAFASKLKLANKELISPTWSAQPMPSERLSKLMDASPLLLSFEAYLYVRGVAEDESVMVEMKREERRHWMRSLKVDMLGENKTHDYMIEAMQFCTSLITLLQGTTLQAYDE